MKCYIHGGNEVEQVLLVKHHKHPTGYGGPDTPENWVYICATCHTILHKMEASLFAKNPGKANDLANQHLPHDPRRRQILTKLAHQAAVAKRDYHENHPNVVPDDPDEVEERTVMVSLELEESLHSRLKIKASEFKHPESGRKVGLYTYITEVLRAHVEKELHLGRTPPKVPKRWDIT